MFAVNTPRRAQAGGPKTPPAPVEFRYTQTEGFVSLCSTSSARPCW